MGHEVICGDAHWLEPGLEGVPIATYGTSELESGGRGGRLNS